VPPGTHSNANLSQWSASSSSWQKVGEVVDAVGSGRRQLYEGQEWDFVFDVDVSEGMPPLKLPYNASGVFQLILTLYVELKAAFRESLGRCSKIPC
jgi:hypothetical protein